MNIDEQLAWFDNLENTPEYHAEDLKTDFAVQIHRMMKRQGISKVDLARRMDTSPAYITKVLRGDANVTIDTMAKLAWYVDGRVHLQITDKNANNRWFEVFKSPPIRQEPECARQWAEQKTHKQAA